MNTTDSAYMKAIRECMLGDVVSPRGMASRELIQHTVEFDMTRPVITIPGRELDYQFMVAEAHWILSGDDKLNNYIRRNLEKYSDDGKTMYGAYGVPFAEQMSYICQKLWEDRDTRQAVMTLWERNPRVSKDIPCTVAMQWLIRDDKLHCNVFMRSQDVWLGLPYDLFSFSMMSAKIMLHLKETYVELTLGTLRITAGSRHLYERNYQRVHNLANSWNYGDITVIYNHRFISPMTLVSYLGIIRMCPSDQVIEILGNEL